MKKKSTKEPVTFFRCKYKIVGCNYQKLYKQLKDNKIHAEKMYEKNSELFVDIPFYNKKRLESICKENGCEAVNIQNGEIIKAITWAIHRPVLFISLFLMLFILLYLKNIVIRFDIKNKNEKIRSDIMNVLTEEGVTAGSYIPDIVLVDVERALKQRVEGISWAGITRKGNSLIIDVIENIPAEKSSYSRFPSNLVAKENATVEKVLLLDGQLKTVIGSGVRKGDIIISGTVETSKSKWTDGKENIEKTIRYTRSMGTIEGTFDRTIVFEQSYDDVIKQETGRKFTQNYLQLFNADIPLFFKSKIGSYYTNEKTSSASIAGKKLPFGIKTLTLTEYDRKPVKYNKQQAEEKVLEKCGKYEKNFLSEFKVKNKETKLEYNEKGVKLEVTYTLYGNICEEAAFFIKK